MKAEAQSERVERVDRLLHRGEEEAEGPAAWLAWGLLTAWFLIFALLAE